jgi:PAS domain S-box-containing protein
VRLPGQQYSDTADAVVETDPRGIVLSWSTTAEQIFGYSSAESAGRLLRELLQVDARDSEPELTQEDCVYEALRRRKDGSLIQINVARRLDTRQLAQSDA